MARQEGEDGFFGNLRRKFDTRNRLLETQQPERVKIEPPPVIGEVPQHERDAFRSLPQNQAASLDSVRKAIPVTVELVTQDLAKLNAALGESRRITGAWVRHDHDTDPTDPRTFGPRYTAATEDGPLYFEGDATVLRRGRLEIQPGSLGPDHRVAPVPDFAIAREDPLTFQTEPERVSKDFAPPRVIVSFRISDDNRPI